MNTGLTSKLYAWPGLVGSGWCFSSALAGLPFQLAVLSLKGDTNNVRHSVQYHACKMHLLFLRPRE